MTTYGLVIGGTRSNLLIKFRVVTKSKYKYPIDKTGLMGDEFRNYTNTVDCFIVESEDWGVVQDKVVNDALAKWNNDNTFQARFKVKFTYTQRSVVWGQYRSRVNDVES